MTTDITELAQSLKAAAIDAKELAIIARYSKGRAAAEKFYALANPNNVIALVEAVEKAQGMETYWKTQCRGITDHCEELQARIAELESFRTAYMEWSNKTDWVRDDRRFDVVKPLGKHLADVLKAYIEHLESRTVAVKQGEVLVTVAGFTGCGKSAIAGEIEIAMKAIGVPVTWANGDSEKRMTGADWLTAIEMYKPTVRIVEVNIPRPAGIKVETE